MSLAPPQRVVSTLWSRAKTVSCSQKRTLFNFPSPFGSSSSSKPAQPPKGTLTKRGSVYVYEESKELPYTQRELYSVIADVDSYEKFLPFAASSKVLSAARRTASGNERQTPNNKGATSVKLAPQVEIRATAKDTSVFSHLETTWTLTPLGSDSKPKTRVDLYLAYAFMSPLHAAAISTMWEKVSGLMIGAFEKRMAETLGKR
ncbi:hypothetical protein ACM66B_002743 [Microbotryomycetes sp. NB124-2]